MVEAAREPALRGGNPKVSAPGVKDHVERLCRSTDIHLMTSFTVWGSKLIGSFDRDWKNANEARTLVNLNSYLRSRGLEETTPRGN